MLYVLSTLVSFGGVFLKGFQHKNVIGGHLRSIFLTSYLMAAFDVAAVSLIVKGGWAVIFSAGTGAAFGMVTAVLVHDKLYAKAKV